MCMDVCARDPPNAELECKVNGVATTSAVTLSAPVLVPNDESGAMALTYDVELVGMARGGPAVFIASASAETIDEEELMCDDGTGVSLLIDGASPVSPTTDEEQLVNRGQAVSGMETSEVRRKALQEERVI